MEPDGAKADAIPREAGAAETEETVRFRLNVDASKSLDTVMDTPLRWKAMDDPERMKNTLLVPKQVVLDLWEQKNRMDVLFDRDYGAMYQRARDELYPCSMVGSRFAGNRAGDKLTEIFDAVKDLAKDGPFAFFDICGGPGAWSRWVLKEFPESTGFGVSLAASVRSCSWYTELTNEPRWKAVWGEGTGNICHERTVAECLEKSVDLALADGGFEIRPSANGKHLENYQELFSGRILVAEVYIALGVLKKGGSFVLKLFDTFSDLTASLIYACVRCFSECWIVKPKHSRVVNSERYLVAKDFHGSKSVNVQHVLFALLQVHTSWLDKHKSPMWVIDKKIWSSDEAFMESIRHVTDAVARTQIRALKRVLDLANEKVEQQQAKWERNAAAKRATKKAAPKKSGRQAAAKQAKTEGKADEISRAVKESAEAAPVQSESAETKGSQEEMKGGEPGIQQGEPDEP